MKRNMRAILSISIAAVLLSNFAGLAMAEGEGNFRNPAYEFNRKYTDQLPISDGKQLAGSSFKTKESTNLKDNDFTNRHMNYNRRYADQLPVTQGN